MFKRQRQSHFTIKNQAQEKRLFRKRLFAGILITLLLSLLLLGRFIYLQVISHEHYTTLSKQNEINLQPLTPKRGLIYDRNGLILAKNIPVFSLMVTPDKTKNFQQELNEIQKIIPLSQVDLRQFKKQSKQHRRFEEVPLKLKLTDKQVAEFAVNRYRFPGIQVKAELIRQYPLGKIFAHTVGYMGRINQQELNQLNRSNYAKTNYIGKTGIEKSLEGTLHGTVGYRRIETDATGRTVRTLSETPPIPGDDLYLTIDSKLQAATLKDMQGCQGALVAIQPDSGQILAMVSTPSFNPNQFVKGISQKNYKKLTRNPNQPLYNRTIHGLYAIGSTIKPFIGLEGLHSNVITPQYKIYDPGWFKVPGTKHVFHDWLRSGHGWVNLHKAIVVSCDTYFYNLAYHLGIKPIDSILNQFGFGQVVGINLPNELNGTVPSPQYKMAMTGKPWYTGDTVNTAIGQGYMQATALQLASATATLANRGVRYQPTLINAIAPAGSTKILQPSKQLTRIKISKENNWKAVIHAMQDVISQGTGFRFGHTPYSVAGKTGTAQVRSDHDKIQTNLRKNERSNGLFIAFAPVKHPKIALAVIVEHNPHKAPVIARKIMDYYLLTEHHWHSGGSDQITENKNTQS